MQKPGVRAEWSECDEKVINVVDRGKCCLKRLFHRMEASPPHLTLHLGPLWALPFFPSKRFLWISRLNVISSSITEPGGISIFFIWSLISTTSQPTRQFSFSLLMLHSALLFPQFLRVFFCFHSLLSNAPSLPNYVWQNQHLNPLFLISMYFFFWYHN